MRTRWSVFAVGCLCGVSVHCSGSDDAAAPGGSTDAGVVADTNAPPTDAAPPTDSGPNLPRVNVAGTLLGRASDNGPLASRDVIIIGADDVVVKTSSDGNGKFSASGVATPYDIGIPYFPTDAAAPALPTFYAGISRPDPIVEGNDYTAPISESQYQATVTWSANVCVGCTMIITAPSDHAQFPGAGPASPFSQPLHWYGPTNITTPIHFYIKDATGAYTSYLDISSQALVSNTPVALGTVGLTPVPSTGDLTFTATPPASYASQSTSLQVNTSDNSQIDLFSTATATLAGKFPLLPGVSLIAAAAATGPVSEYTTGQEQLLAASAAPTLAMNLPIATALLTPTDHSTGVALSLGLTWSAFASPIVYSGTLTGPSGGYISFYSATPAIDFSKLAKAEMAVAPATTYTWGVSAGGLATKMDEFVAVAPSGLGVPSYRTASVYQTFTTQ
jgi:hypothetical protein